MKTPALFLVLFAALSAAAQSNPARWLLVKSTLTYRVSDALHEVTGVSRAARGKGVCADGQCSFLVAAPVQSFRSGDSNRDLHMMQAVRGALDPMVIVRTQLPQSAIHPGLLHANVRVRFGGEVHTYPEVAFTVVAQGRDLRLTGTLPIQLSDFGIKSPQFLFIAVKNLVPVDIVLRWRPTP